MKRKFDENGIELLDCYYCGDEYKFYPSPRSDIPLMGYHICSLECAMILFDMDSEDIKNIIMERQSSEKTVREYLSEFYEPTGKCPKGRAGVIWPELTKK